MRTACLLICRLCNNRQEKKTLFKYKQRKKCPRSNIYSKILPIILFITEVTTTPHCQKHLICCFFLNILTACVTFFLTSFNLSSSSSICSLSELHDCCKEIICSSPFSSAETTDFRSSWKIQNTKTEMSTQRREITDFPLYFHRFL